MPTKSKIFSVQAEFLREKMAMFVTQDRRLSTSQSILRDEKFAGAALSYFRELSEINHGGSDFEKLRAALVGYIAVVDGMFEAARPRFLTAMRQAGGNLFVEVYKKSKTLLKMVGADIDGDGLSKLTNVPDQHPSPIYAKVEADKILLDAGHALHPLLKRGALARTKDYLQQELGDVGRSLKTSNVDPRLLDTFLKLGHLLEFKDDAGAIALGLHVRLVSHVMKSIEDELSDVLALQISSTLTHVSYFASQYKDWIEFIKNAQHYPAREVVELEIEQALQRVGNTLAAHSVVVDERIPESFRLITQLLRGEKEDRVNAVYAGIRGFENVCIVAVRYAFEEATKFLRDVGTRARPSLVTIGAGAIIYITVSIISDFLPVIKSAPELSWILENMPRIEKINQILK
jgi:hypothetical protein